jgi:hypothetical protein
VVLGVAVLALMPFIEESWLRQRFGAEYEKYYSSGVARFVGLIGWKPPGASAAAEGPEPRPAAGRPQSDTSRPWWRRMFGG